jgi:hypothetical protein
MSDWNDSRESLERASIIETLEADIINVEDREKAAELLMVYRDLIIAQVRLEATLEQLQDLREEARGQGLG